MNIYKKINSPIVYWVFSYVAYMLSFFAMAFYDNVFGFNKILFERTGALELGIIVFIISVAVFWFANKIIQSIENLKKPTIKDHFRQSAILYVLFIIWFIGFYKILPITCQSDCHGLAFVFMAGFTKFVGIVLNLIFLLRLKRS